MNTENTNMISKEKVIEIIEWALEQQHIKGTEDGISTLIENIINS